MSLGKKIWWLPACALAALLFAAIYRLAHPEPFHNGRNFSSWFHEAETMHNAVYPSPSTLAIVAMGSNAVPLLAARVRAEDSWWVKYYWFHYPNWPGRIRGWLPTPRPPGARQENAARLLAEIGPAARAAAPDLVATYKRAYFRYYQLPPPAKLDWPALFTNPPVPRTYGPASAETGLRLFILLALSRCGDDNPEIIPLLFTATHDAFGIVREQATNQLCYNTNLTAACRVSESFAVLALGDTNSSVRALAAITLGRVGPNHPGIVAPLLKAAEDPDATVRHEALLALQKVRPDLEYVLPVLGRIIAGPDGADRGAALRVLSKSAGSANIIPALSGELENADPQVRMAAAQILPVYGGNAQIAIPKLQQLTNAANEPNDSVRRAAAEALKRIAPK